MVAGCRHGAFLIAALIILVIAAAVLPPTWWGVLGLLTTLLLVPWILLFPPTAPTEIAPTETKWSAPEVRVGVIRRWPTPCSG